MKSECEGVYTVGLVVDTAGPGRMPSSSSAAASRGHHGEISAVVTFHCHGNGLRVTPGGLHTTTPIYSAGVTPGEPWRMSGQSKPEVDTCSQTLTHNNKNNAYMFFVL